MDKRVFSELVTYNSSNNIMVIQCYYYSGIVQQLQILSDIKRITKRISNPTCVIHFACAILLNYF